MLHRLRGLLVRRPCSGMAALLRHINCRDYYIIIIRGMDASLCLCSRLKSFSDFSEKDFPCPCTLHNENLFATTRAPSGITLHRSLSRTRKPSGDNEF